MGAHGEMPRDPLLSALHPGPGYVTTKPADRVTLFGGGRPRTSAGLRVLGPLEAQALRSSLAYGIKPLVQGEHTSSVFGSLHGSRHPSACSCPVKTLPWPVDSPKRSSGSLGLPESVALPALENDPYRKRGEDDDEDHELATQGDPDEAEESELEQPRPKKFRVALIIALFGLCFGFIHLYAERSVRGLVLIAVAAVGFILMQQGLFWGPLMITSAIVFDLIAGGLELLSFNRQLEARKQAAFEPSPTTNAMQRKRPPTRTKAEFRGRFFVVGTR